MKEQMLQILIELSKGFKSPDSAQSELLGLFSVTKSVDSAVATGCTKCLHYQAVPNECGGCNIGEDEE
jgi:hypothetical protein